MQEESAIEVADEAAREQRIKEATEVATRERFWDAVEGRVSGDQFDRVLTETTSVARNVARATGGVLDAIGHGRPVGPA